jgi:hypothetical protein
VAFRRASSAGSGRSVSGGRPGERDLSPRALEAMAHAVARSRQTPGPPEKHGRRPGTDRERRLRVSVVVTGVAVLVAGAALAAADASGSGGDLGSSTTLPPVHTPTPPAHPTDSGGAAGHTTTTTPGARSVTTTSTTVPPPRTAGGGLAIASLFPATGGPGTPLTVTGSGFLSADGTIVAEVDGQAAPTSVTVPSLPVASGSVPVTVTTAAGTSAPASFSYGGGVGAGTSPTPPAVVATGGGLGSQSQTRPGPGQRGGSRDRPGKFP